MAIEKRRTWKVGEKPKGPLSRIRAFLLQDITAKPVVLNEKEKKMQSLFNKCFAYMSNGFERRDVVRLLISNDEVTEGNAHNIINLTLELYGDIYKSSLKGQKAVERENYIRLSREAENAAKNETDGEVKAKLLLVATKNRELASKISGTFVKEAEKEQRVILPAIILSSDTSILERNKVIDITHGEEEED